MLFNEELFFSCLQTHATVCRINNKGRKENKLELVVHDNVIRIVQV